MTARERSATFDCGAHVVDSKTFRLLVDLEVQKAQRLRYCISLLCLATELPEDTVTDAIGNPIATLLARHLRATDALAPYGQSYVAILLVDAETGHLPSIMQRLTEYLETIPWSAGGSCYPRQVTTSDDMLKQAVNLMIQAKETGGNRLIVPP